MRNIILFALCQLLFLTGCGGGSGDGLLSASSSTSGSSSSSSSGSTSSSGSGQTIATINETNAITMTVDAGPSGASGEINIPYVSVTICAPGSTTNCQTIDHMEVDIGSYGVRVMSSVLTSTLAAALPQETVSGSVSGNLVECIQWGDGYSWGSMHTADVGMGTEKASSQSIQVIGDTNYPNIPSACTSAVNYEEDSVATFGANGIIGVGPFVQDCPDCVESTETPWYWACSVGSGGSCAQTLVSTAQLATNPVASFAADNNGVILELPAIADAGVATATGALVFGIGTESNNALGSANVLTTDDFGYITTNFNNTTLPDGIIDSGSNLIYFNDGSITTYGSASNGNEVYDPSAELPLSAVEEGQNNVQVTVDFNINNAVTLFENNPSFAAFDDIGAPYSDTQGFVFGLPFFYGRNVFTAIQGMNTSGGTGPYFAF